jgi:hypothetical protein
MSESESESDDRTAAWELSKEESPVTPAMPSGRPGGSPPSCTGGDHQLDQR